MEAVASVHVAFEQRLLPKCNVRRADSRLDQ